VANKTRTHEELAELAGRGGPCRARSLVLYSKLLGPKLELCISKGKAVLTLLLCSSFENVKHW
jgi:hypothetical protein